MTEPLHEFRLSRDEYQMLIFALGFATGAAFSAEHMGYGFLKLSNLINRDNPNWHPYEIPDEFQWKSGCAKPEPSK